MTPRDFIAVAVTPALSLLPERMDSPAARAMIVAIALVESDLEHRRQKNGPARSYVQFEQAGVAGVLMHPTTADLANAALSRMDYPGAVAAIHTAMEFDAVLACVFARLLLWTIPVRLPQPTETELSFKQYAASWRPGKPKPDRWPERYQRAWLEVLA